MRLDAPTKERMLETERFAKPLVLRVIPSFHFGGVESRFLLQGRLSKNEPYRLHVCVLDGGGEKIRELRDLGVGVTVLGQSPSIRNTRATLALNRTIRRLRPHVVHSSIVEANFHSILASRTSTRSYCIAEEVGMPRHGRITQNVFRVLYRYPDVLVGVTDAVCEYMKNYNGAPAHKLRRIYNCADPAYFPAIPREPRPPRSNTDPFTFLHVARFHPVKNQMALLRAFSLVSRKWPQARLRMVGDGPLRVDLERMTCRLNISHAVDFVGFKPDVRAEIVKSDAFVLPSIDEGCSISLIEALSQGRLAVGSNVPGIVEVFGEEHARQWSFDPYDDHHIASKMLKCRDLGHDEVLDSTISLQRRMYEIFSPAAYMAELRKLYRLGMWKESVE